MSKLDDIADLKLLDPGDMYGAITSFPDQIRNAITISQEMAIDPDYYNDPDGVFLCGMGGSAIGGDLARSLLADRLKIPFLICRNYNLPAHIGKNSIVIGSSYSGNTEETLSALRQAMDTGSRLFIMTTGGKLGEIAKTKNIMRVALPTGFQPRAALGYSFVPLMLFLNRIGLSYYTPEDFQQLAQFLDERKAAFVVDADSSTNRAKQLAMLLYGRIPVIYSGPELTDVVGTRIKGQICENAKMLAFNNQFPEFNHNELVGWKVLNSFRDYLRVIVIRDRDDHPRISARMDIVKKVIEKTGVDVFEVNSEGQDKLQRVFSLIQLGDFISYYLSILNKVDPTPVEAIEVLKQELVRI